MKPALALVITLAFAVPAAAGEPSTTEKQPTAPATRQHGTEGKPAVADSFSFGVEREMKESGEKGGTADINIGIGESQASQGDGPNTTKKQPTAPTEKQPTAPTTRQYGAEGKPFVADSFSFGVEREMKESGEKGGTADINIGIGEMQDSEGDGSKAKAKPKP